MESLRGPINSSLFFGEEMSLEATDTRSAMNMVPQMTFLHMLQAAIMQPGGGGGGGEETTEEEIEQESYFRPEDRPPPTKERNKKRKRPRQHSSSNAKTAQEAESQRMTHIAVERNRRRLMNSHIHSLRSLMPSSFIRRSDQASIIGGAIDFVKELEQLLLSLRAEKRVRLQTATTSSSLSDSTTLSVSNEGGDAVTVLDGFFVSPQYTRYTEGLVGVDVEATVVQEHVNVKVAARRRPGQLVRVVAALEELGLLVLHLNITSLDSESILYSLNLKMEEECRLGSPDEIATAVNHVFTYITACC